MTKMQNNWPIKKLGEVTKIVGGGTPSTQNESYWGGDYFWATPRDLAQLKIADINSTARTITEFGLEHSSAELLPVGTVILSSRAPIGYVAITTEPMAINQGCRAFICGGEINNRYLYYFLVISKKYLQSLGRGATFTEINKSTLENIKISLPPLNIQKQIVEQLDKIAEAQKLNDDLIQKSDELFQSLLHSLIRANSGIVKKLGEVAEIIMGQSPPSSTYNEKGEGLPFFQGKAEFGEIYPTPVKYCRKPTRIAEAGDILMSVRAPVGNINLAKEKSGIGRGLGAIRARKGVDQSFLYFFFIKNENNWSRLSVGSTFSAIRRNNLDNLEVPIPPFETQKQIIAKLSAVQNYKKQLLEQKVKLKELFDSALHKSMF